MPFANGRWSFVVAAWIAPLLFVRFLRAATLKQAWGGGIAILAMASFVWWLGVFPVRGAAYVIAALVLGTATLLPYMLDRRYAQRLGGIAGSLVLPCATVAMEIVNSLTSPFGTWGSYAYAQAGFTPLMQLASITGLAGITFLVMWLAAAQHDKRAMAICVTTIGVVLLFGAMRMRTTDDANVRIAAITPGVPTYTSERVKAARDPRVAQAINEDLLRASDVDADVVLWSEGAGIVSKADEATLIAHAAELARRRGVWIEIAYLALHEKGFANRNVLVDAQGQTRWTYDKARPVPLMERFAPGDGRVPIVSSPIGKVATVICFDGDFPRHVRQAAGADVLLIPADDWREVARLHTNMIRFRAIEQGVSIVRATSNGFSTAIDRFGRIRASSNYFDGARVLRAGIAGKGQPTLYARIGDATAIAAVALLIVLIALAEFRAVATRSVAPQLDARTT
jgi:apolipoprotein N-acyltransferase